MRPRLRLLLLCGLWLATAGAALGQAAPDSLTRRFSRYQQTALAEKLFVHLDRPVYVSGELMWFKVYAVDGTSGRPLALSTVAYVEVLDKANQAVLQGKVQLKNAAGQGSFSLPSALASGTYTVRAYTSWMKNFGPEYYFHSSVTVLNTFSASGTAAKDSAATAADVQFFPEGGQLVPGLGSRVAFKVTDKTGKGVAATGKVLDQQGRPVAAFRTLRFGMGSFTFTPEAGNTYSAVVTLDKNQVLRRPLPAAQAQGYVLRLENASPESLTLAVSTPPATSGPIYLLAHSRQQVAMTAQATLAGGQAVFTIPKSQLLDGISHFTVFGPDQKPRAERLYFQPPRRQLAVTATADQARYTTRGKVALQVATAASDARPTGANLSLAVYRLDSLNTAPAADINSYLWLAADLKGVVENPAYYFTSPSPETAEAADNLMLTQGWSRFRWEQVLAAAPVPFAELPELHGPVVRGRVVQNGTTKPLPGLTAYLASPSRIIRLTNAVSNAQGLVQFELNDFYGPHDVIAQTDPRQDSTARVELFSPFSAQYAASTAAAFAPIPRFRPDYARRHLQTQVQNTFSGRYKNVYDVPAADSLAFYGPADETYFLDKYTRFKVVEEVLREYVQGVLVKNRKDGFHFSVDDKINQRYLDSDPMTLLDGVPIFNTNKMMAMDPLKIQKLEVVDSRYFHGAAIYDGLVSFTTYKGDLEGFPLDSRVLVQQYEGMQWQREFYSPRYDTPELQRSRLPDLRNLLYWNGSVATAAGAATPLSFYTGDQAGRYLVVVQGLSPDGLAGSTTLTLEVKPAL